MTHGGLSPSTTDGVWIFALAPCLRLCTSSHLCVVVTGLHFFFCRLYCIPAACPAVLRQVGRMWVPDTPRGVFFRVVVVYRLPQATLAVNACNSGYWSCCFHALSTVVDSCRHIQPVPGILPTCPLSRQCINATHAVGSPWPLSAWHTNGVQLWCWKVAVVVIEAGMSPSHMCQRHHASTGCTTYYPLH